MFAVAAASNQCLEMIGQACFIIRFCKEHVMTTYADKVVIPYDRDLGPMLFEHFGHDTARRIAERSPSDVLEIAAGTGIVTRHLRNLLPKEPV